MSGGTEKIEIEEVVEQGPKSKARETAGAKTFTVTPEKPYTKLELKKDLLAGLLYLGLAILGIMLLFDTFQIDLHVPVIYGGGDECTMLADTKAIIEQGWCLTIDRMGAPGQAEYYDYPTSTLHNTDLVILKFFSLFTHETGLILNLTYFTLICLAGLNLFIALRILKVRRSLSIMAGLLFAFSPYMDFRSIAHLVLSNYMVLPFAMLLCVWMYTDPDYMRIGKGWSNNWHNWATILFAFLIGNTGIVYYPFMTGFVLLIAGIARAITDRDIRKVFRSLLPSVMIIVFMFLAYLPSLIHILQYGKSSDGVDRSGVLSESEEVGLKLILLFMPYYDKGNPYLAKAIDRAHSSLYPINENQSAYLGVIACIGFVILLFELFNRRKDRGYRGEIINCLAAVNLGILILGISDGLGTIIAYVSNLGIRCYNRVSIFIMCFSLAALAVLLDGYLEKHEKRVKWIIPVFAIITALGLWDQFGTPWSVITANSDSRNENWYVDKAFCQQMEDTEEDGAMIMQLPYHSYPEGGWVEDMPDYMETIEYVHTDTLRFSYGSMEGSAADRAWERLAELPPEEMVKQARAEGWSGICIERRGLSDEDEQRISEGLSAALEGHTHFMSQNGNLEYFSLNN